jgi:Tfp pilus assembly protein PilV
MKINKRQTGVGLIEALVAALVFALGITALVKLQGTFFKNSSAANAHSIAMTIAQEKLEDLRGFQISDSSDGDIFDFTSIGTNTGGRCTEQTDNNTCTVSLASTGANQNITVGNTGFSRNWTVTDYYFDSAGVLCTPFPTGTTPNTCVASSNTSPDQKRITVNVTWTDTDGSAQSLALDGLINRNSGASIGAMANFGSGGSGESPTVPYTPSTDVHVTPIGVGTDTKRETLVPSTETVDGYSRTKFIAYTYNNAGELVREEEFQNVACDCRFDGVSDDANKTYTAAHPTWNSTKDTYVDVDGDLVSGKAKGCVQGGGNNCSANPDPLCEVCCRDHHDTSTAAFKFDPFRSNDDFINGNHKHYNGTAAVTSGQYLEACRLKRVDGNWRVYEDWHMVKFTALPLSDLVDTTIKATYADYVQDIIDQHLDESKVAGQTLTSPPTKPSTLDHTVSNNYVSMSVGEKRELTGRAVFLDFIDSTHLTNVINKKTATEDYLLHLPFYELEVASLSDWNSSQSTKLNVGPYDDTGTAHDLIGGELEALDTDSDAINVTGSIKKSNSGVVALSSAVDYNAAANPDSSLNSDMVSICVGCSGPASCTLPWGDSINSGSSETAYQTSSVPYGQTCASETRTCTNGTLSGSYLFESCTVGEPANCTAPWGDTIAHGSSVDAYLVANDPNGQCNQNKETRVCSNGTLSGSYTNKTCDNLGNNCATPWGTTVADGSSATAYQTSSVPYGQSCVSESRICSNGNLSGSYSYQTCSVLAAANCASPWGTAVLNGNSVTAYLSSSVVSPSTCTSENRGCSNGTLSGTYTNQNCTVTVSTCSTTVTGKANNNSDTITVSVDGSPTSCSVAANKNYTCNAVTSPLTATITVTSSGTVNSTVTVTPICGAKTVNF